MPYCPYCGVEVEPKLVRCPLCEKALPPDAVEPPETGHSGASGHSGHSGHAGHAVTPEADAAGPQQEDLSRRLVVAWEVLGVSVLIVSISVAAMNYFLSRRIEWAFYPILALVFVWLVFTAVVVFRKAPAAMFAGIALLPPLLLVGIDAVRQPVSWSIMTALPIALLVEAVIAIGALAIARLRRKGLNTVAIFLLVVAGICLGIELVLDLGSAGGIALQWSLVITICLMPVAIFLFYIHHRLGTRITMRRYFHL